MTTLTERREIRHLHLFCGLGGGAKGFNRGSARVANLQAHFRCIGGIDIDAGAVRDFERMTGVKGTLLDLFDREQYQAFHGFAPPVGWTEAAPEDIQSAAGHERPHIVFMSPPCLPADGLVITEAGPRPIATIRAGDKVLTHRGRLQPVSHVGTEAYAGTMHGIRLHGSVDHQWFTDKHPVWIRRVVRRKKNGIGRALGDARFEAAEHLKAGDRVGFPVERAIAGTAQAFIDSFGRPQEAIRGGRSTGRYAKPKHLAILGKVTDLRPHAAAYDLWYLIGCYLGDGYRRKTNGYEICFCVGPQHGPLAHQVRSSLKRLGLASSDDVNGGPGNVKIRVTSKHLHRILGAFGDGAENKRVPPALFSVEDEVLCALIQGYRDTDGSEQGSRLMPRGNTLQARWKIPSVSLQLLRDFQRLLLRRGEFGSIHKCWPGGLHTIMGRTVSTLPRWELNVRLAPKKRTIFEFIDGVVWVRIREIVCRETKEPVWNLSVAEDDTFCVPMMATHNCKGFSGLLSARKSASEKYQALNRLTLRGVFLMLEAFRDDLPELVLLENVPRIQTRGRELLDRITSLLRFYGYAVAETTHDCGELGGLAQSRKRFLMVARLTSKVPSFLYEPPKRPLRAVGEVLEKLPMPGDPRGGPMHLLPNLQWKTWVRLAFVEAGSDWRSLNRLRVAEGTLLDYVLTPERYADVLGALPWSSLAGTITGGAAPTRGAFSVADPRYEGSDYAAFGVNPWGASMGTITSQRSPGQGLFSVADPRTGTDWHHNIYRVTGWDETRGTVTSGSGPSNGSGAVADPRPPAGQMYSKYAVTPWRQHTGTVIGGDDQGAYAVADPRAAAGFGGKGKYRVTSYTEPSNTVIAQSTTGHGSFAVADPRLGLNREKGDDYLTAGHYGVVPWDQPCGAVAGCAAHDNGRFNVADPRLSRLPDAEQKLVVLIRSLDGTWHRPFTTLELASLQSLVDPEELGDFDGNSDGAKRERIGNAVPPDAATSIANVMAETLLLSWAGQSFQLSATPIWVRDIAVALAVHQPDYVQ